LAEISKWPSTTPKSANPWQTTSDTLVNLHSNNSCGGVMEYTEHLAWLRQSRQAIICSDISSPIFRNIHTTIYMPST